MSFQRLLSVLSEAFAQVATWNVSFENTPILCIQLVAVGQFLQTLNVHALTISKQHFRHCQASYSVRKTNMTSAPAGLLPAGGGYYCDEGLLRCVVSDSIFITIICSSFIPAGCTLRSFASHLTKWKSSWKCFLLLQGNLVHWGVLLCALCLTFLPDTYQVRTLVLWL